LSANPYRGEATANGGDKRERKIDETGGIADAEVRKVEILHIAEKLQEELTAGGSW